MADVRRNEETVRFRLDQRLLHPVRRGAPDRESPVAVVVREHHQEGFLLSYEEGGRPVAEALARLRQRETEGAEPLQDPGSRSGAHRP